MNIEAITINGLKPGKLYTAKDRWGALFPTKQIAAKWTNFFYFDKDNVIHHLPDHIKTIIVEPNVSFLVLRNETMPRDTCACQVLYGSQVGWFVNSHYWNILFLEIVGPGQG
jgi:hypothetical protein